MATPEIPEDAAGWTAFLNAKQLPATPQTGTLVLSLLRQKDAPYQKLAAAINQDPILSFYVMAATNENAAGNTSRSNSLDHAISMIGVQRLEKITAKASYFKPDPSNIRHFYYLRALSTSHYAAALMEELAKHKSHLNPESSYWASLFYGTPWWYLWRFATPEMRLIRYAVRSNGKSQEHAEKEVLGCTIREIGIALSKKLALPPLTLECYKLDKALSARQIVSLSRLAHPTGAPDLVEDKTLRHLLQSPSFSITLCNMLAQQSTHDWYSSATLRCQKVLSVLLGWPLHKTVAMTHQVAASMSRAHPYVGVMSPAAKLMLPPREYIRVNSFADNLINQLIQTSPKALNQLGDAKPTSKPVEVAAAIKANADKPAMTETALPAAEKSISTPPTETVPVKAAPVSPTKTTAKPEAPSESNRKLNLTLFKQLTDSLVNQPEQFSDLHEIMNAAVQGITYGLGLKRSTVALANTKLTRLKAYYTVGTRQFPELGNFQIDLTKPSLFSRLMEKQAGIWVGSTTQRSTWNMIPAEFKRISGASEFFLMSVFVLQKPVAVFYADGGIDAPAATDWEYRQFKHMCACVTKCLNFQASRSHKPAE
ncbi:MAG: HDOD domain-containing protein [Hahellaceae bacterium]|nr:HDOD domain-containing protein [Hahellaceae bacterium]MCP5211143.1 HDOD domain-containing protein [Hahellaceae bacterium]